MTDILATILIILFIGIIGSGIDVNYTIDGVPHILNFNVDIFK